METSTRTTRSQETDTSNDFDSLYYELEKRILTLISDDEKEDFGESMAVKQSNPMWINRPRPILEQQTESYFCWNHDNYETSSTLAPVWLLNLWSQTRNGTGVFIPVAMRTRYRNLPRRQTKARKLAEKTSD